MTVRGEAWLVVVVAVLDALLGTALGLSVSALATTEFQAVQFMPAFILPQLLLCGFIVRRTELPTVLHWISYLLPMS
jgi:ABC-2 type transport system permease protein